MVDPASGDLFPAIWNRVRRGVPPLPPSLSLKVSRLHGLGLGQVWTKSGGRRAGLDVKDVVLDLNPQVETRSCAARTTLLPLSLIIVGVSRFGCGKVVRIRRRFEVHDEVSEKPPICGQMEMRGRAVSVLDGATSQNKQNIHNYARQRPYYTCGPFLPASIRNEDH
jgi:hypothetical protein